MRNPFAVGDPVVFLPNDRTRHWLGSAFARWRLHPGHQGTVTAVIGPVVELDGKAGFPISYLWCRPVGAEEPNQGAAAVRQQRR